MKQDHINYIAVGGFILVMLLLLSYVLFRVTGHDTTQDSYYTELRNVAGIDEGTPVTYNGYHIGHIQSITPKRVEGKTRYLLEISVRQDWPIPKDSRAIIDAPSILAEFVLNIQEGRSKELLKPGSQIKGKEAVNLYSAISAIGADFNDLSVNGIKPLLDNLNDQISTISNSIDKGLPSLFDNANSLLDQLKSSAAKLQGIIGGKNEKHINNIFENSDRLSRQLLEVSKEFRDASTNLNQLLDKSNEMVNTNNPDVRKAVVELRKSLDTVSESIGGIVYNIESATRNMSEFSRQLRDNPSVIISGKPPADMGEQHR